MATIKAYTDIEQSKRLAEILPPESADMWYDNDGESIAGRPEVRCGSFVGLASINIPCWSLAALLNVLPRPSLHQTTSGKWYCDAEPNRLYFSEHYDNSIDACYEMIIKIYELSLL